jgi:hypothetical protein
VRTSLSVFSPNIPPPLLFFIEKLKDITLVKVACTPYTTGVLKLAQMDICAV